MYLRTKNKFVRQGIQKLELKQLTETQFLLLWLWPRYTNLTYKMYLQSEVKFLSQGFQKLELEPHCICGWQ